MHEHANKSNTSTPKTVQSSANPQGESISPYSVAQMMHLQRTMGNRAVMQMMKQARPASTPASSPIIQRQPESAEEETTEVDSEATGVVANVTASEEAGAGGAEAPSTDGGGAPAAQDSPKNSKLDTDLALFKSRCEKYADVLDSAFVAKFEKYVQCLGANNKDEGMPLLAEVLAHLNSVKAFQIPADQFGKVDPSEAEKFSQNTSLWSKTNKYMPNEQAEAAEGVTLESSLAGYLFDGLDFGIDYSTSDLLKAQWKEVSHNFVKHAKGTVHAHILLGVTKESVLYKTEADIVLKKLQSGEVTKVIVNYYKTNLTNGSEFEMAPYKKKEITTAEEWTAALSDTVPTIPIGEVMVKGSMKKMIAKIDTSGIVYKTIQNFTHVSENKKHAPK